MLALPDDILSQVHEAIMQAKDDAVAYCLALVRELSEGSVSIPL